MGEDAGLEALCARARREPLAPRAGLHAALAGGRLTFLSAAGAQRGTDGRAGVWAEREPVFGSLWVPVFSGAGPAEAFAARAREREGSALAVSADGAAALFAALLEVPCFAGVRLDPGHEGAPRLERHEVAALSDGRLPEEAPALRDLEGRSLELPEGVDFRFGEADPAFGPPGRRAVFPAAPGFSLEDFRCLVELDLGGARAWAPCRNLAAALAAAPAPIQGRVALDEALVEMLTAFGMLGEAEALCARALADGTDGAWALGPLGCVLRRAGRLEECVRHCRTALERAPDESRLYRSLALACAELEDLTAAREAARRGLARFPDDATFRRLA